ncbi:DNA/RNA polymerase [Mycena crocata]|nr:DNA/RNA polymerase [Mycena crocata]
MLISRACRRTLPARGGRTTAPPRTRSRAYAAAAVAMHRDGLQNFLQRQTAYTVLPTPLPQNVTSPENDYWFSNSATQELLAVMDACLYDLYDVPRAKGIFDRLRTQGSGVLEIRVVNAMLEAYVKMAGRSEPEYWVEAVWELFDATTSPSASTYAIILLAIHRFPEYAAQSYASVLTSVLNNKIPIQRLVSDRVFTDDDEASEIIKELSSTAVTIDVPSVVVELGEAEALAIEELDPVPEAHPVKKGEKVPFNLETLRKHLNRVALARRVLPTDLNARQKLLESSVYDAAKERLRHEHEVFAQLGLDNALLQPDLRRWMWEWHSKLKVRLEKEIKNLAVEEEHRPVGRKKIPVLAPYLSLVKAERLSILTILEIMRLANSGGITEGMKTARALIEVGKAVENEYKAHIRKKHGIEIPPSELPPRDYYSSGGYRDLRNRRVAAVKLMEDDEAWSAPWTQAVRSQVGAILVECLMEEALVPRTAFNKVTQTLVTEEQPALYQSYEYLRGQKLGVIRLNTVVCQRLAKDPLPMHPRHLPMLIKPKPWINFDEGGYLTLRTHVMRFKESVEQRSYLKQASEQGNIELVYAGLDVLGSTPWRINKRIFDVVLKVWNDGIRLGKMPPEVYDEPEPEAPPEYEIDLSQRNVYLTRLRAYNQAKAANHSDRCSVNYKIEISRSFLNDVFYLPHNVDFRGRAYPIPPHLNHIGDDLSRGLLIFADKKPLGERGFRWLKIHLSNLYGFDKANFDERAAFTEEHMDDVYDSVLNPLTGRGWWQKADDPWQCLATCMEVYSAIESGDPLTYECALPVHQDGTCNGLQHYAALGGDHQGARQVNLSAGDRPSDVYTFVGNMVEKMLEVDAARGDRFAKMLVGKVSRKVVKQTVMTTVYGVTFIGARDQIEKQLKDRKDLPEEECWLAASYLAKKVLTAIGDLFTGANHIQTWLNLCARLISKSIPEERIAEVQKEHKNKPPLKVRKNAAKKTRPTPDTIFKKEQMTSVVWTTPLGLPICQPYRKTARKQVFTAMQTVYISDPGTPAEVNSMKQASAFPPNFIHSLDATHMMLTAIECRVQGLTFASVHDSYWTHASSIDTMSEVIRDTFIALHSSDVLKRLHQEFVDRYKGFKVPLVHLRNGQLVKKLHAAGTRIKVTEEEARNLWVIRDLLVESDTAESDVQVKQVYDGSSTDVMADLASLIGMEDSPKVVGRPRRLKRVKIEGEEEDYEDEEEDDAAQKAEDEAEAMKQLMNKFVDVEKLLPPLPEKGSFQVSDIKQSQYFFS